MSIGIYIFLITFLVAIVSSVIIACISYKYEISKVSKENLKLLQFKVKKNKIDCCFLDAEGKKYIMHIRRFLLRKKYIPEEFAIESNPRTNYYHHIKSELKVGKEYNVTFYFSLSDEKFMLSLEKKLE